MRIPGGIPRLAAVVAIAVLVPAACGGGSSKSSSTTTAPTTTASTAPPITVNSAQATSEITAVWESFFGPTGTADEVQGMDAQLQSAFQKEKSSPLGAGVTAKVLAVSVQPAAACTGNGVPAPCATVTYDLLKAGKVELPNASGYASMPSGKWQVSKTTFCALIALGSGGAATPGC